MLEEMFCRNFVDIAHPGMVSRICSVIVCLVDVTVTGRHMAKHMAMYIVPLAWQAVCQHVSMNRGRGIESEIRNPADLQLSNKCLQVQVQTDRQIDRYWCNIPTKHYP